MLPLLVLSCVLANPVSPAQVSGPVIPGIIDDTPNLRIAVSHVLADCLGRTPVDRCDTFCETILGAKVKGLGRTVGEVHLEFVPSTNGAVVDLVMTGTNTPIGANVGIKGPAIAISDGDTLISARKRLYIFPEGITTVPATADASPAANIRRIDTTLPGPLDKLVQNLAKDIAARDREKTLAIARSLAIDKLMSGFDDDVNPRLQDWNRQLEKEFRAPLEKRKLYPERLHFLTDTAYLHVLGRLTDPNGLTPIGPPPALPAGTHVAAWVHESLPNSLLAKLLSGKKLVSTELDKELKPLLGDRAPGGGGGEERPPSEIVFAEKQPLAVTFSEDEVQISLRTQTFRTLDEDEGLPNRNVAVTVRYGLKVEKGQVLANRVGEMKIEPADGKKASARFLQVARLMRNILDPLFPQEIKEKGIFMAPPAVSRRIGKFEIERLISQGGWLAVAVRALPPIVE